MKLFGWAIVLAAAGLTPAAAQEPQASAQAAAPQAGAPATPAAQPAVALPEGSPTSPRAVAQQPGGAADPAAGTPSAPAQADANVLPDSPLVGVPNGGKGIQEQVTAIGQEAAAFHNNWLLLLCVLISIVVLVLLVYAMVKFRRSANPIPSRNSHNTVIEVIWTVVPVLILVAIAIPSMRLLRHQYSPPKADLTVKVIGNQWYWTYQYPDNGGVEIVSNMLKEQGDVPAGQRFRTDKDGPRLLAVDERLVIPAGKVVKFIVTSNDVIHAFWIPAFWNKIDANPGQLNETWVKVDKPGVYFGQCTELCGARHAYMPISVEVVPQDQFNRWMAAKGGTIAGARPAATPAAAPATGGTAGLPVPPPPATPGTVQGNPAPAPTNPDVANRATTSN
ncbi:cytochrome c oxidase subunit II [Sphingomonas piscis]|uniref:Cytochrome c oxidase subunit 2 n=1 Tax=Sphingomonas piscis TaxID=2714943 RepID=A0A6G7YQ71_9SPHN|nr:cytochrome c oxidase subunit II [Sphingomonas piscis]QIK78884.1 cytochrome c oxidase subunit II [Sphingomonas piscis]